jgi:hypothetical protein
MRAAQPQGSNRAESIGSAAAKRAGVGVPSGSGRAAARGTLSGQYDTVNIGAFAFSLYNSSQLQVNQLRSSGNVGGQFWLADLPAGIWHRLSDRGERLLPVWIRIHGIDVDVQVQGGPSSAPILQATDMLPKFVG